MDYIVGENKLKEMWSAMQSATGK